MAGLISLKLVNTEIATRIFFMEIFHPSNHSMIRMLNADPSVVSSRAKKRGLPQLGTLGAGNHYAEIQVDYLSGFLGSGI